MIFGVKFKVIVIKIHYVIFAEKLPKIAGEKPVRAEIKQRIIALHLGGFNSSKVAQTLNVCIPFMWIENHSEI